MTAVTCLLVESRSNKGRRFYGDGIICAICAVLSLRILLWEPGETQASIARSVGVSRMAISKALKKIAKLGRIQLSDLYDSVLVH